MDAGQCLDVYRLLAGEFGGDLVKRAIAKEIAAIERQIEEYTGAKATEDGADTAPGEPDPLA